MKLYTRSLVILALFILLLESGSFMAGSTGATFRVQIAMVYLARPTNLDLVLNEIASYNVDVLAFHRQQRFGNQVITDGFYLTPNDRAKIKTESKTLQERYWQSYGATLVDLSQAMPSNSSQTGSDSQEAPASQEDEMLNQQKKDFSIIDGCWINHTCPDIEVVSLLILGNATSFSTLSASPLIERIDIKPLEGKVSEYKPTPIASLSSYESWVPSRGSINIHPSVVPGERYVENQILWDTASRLSAFGSDSTYEHDFFLNDSDTSGHGPGTYLSDAQNILGEPTVSYWVSDLPRPYLDTRFGDPSYVKAFTIGSAEADSIQPGIFYYYYIRTSNGDANIDNGYLVAQIGQRNPSWCYTTWCAFGVQDPEVIYSPSTYNVDPIPGDFIWIATFADVPPYHWAVQNIDQLYNSGVTGGCAVNPLRYCPTDYVTRAQMAVFLLKGIHGSSYLPPNPTGIFSDVPTNHWAARWIEQLYREVITGGCALYPLRYCPEDSTTHAQMAVFLLRAKYGSYYTPPSATGSVYADVPYSHWAARWIEQAAEEGIFDNGELLNDGCPSGYFCPETPVTRALMVGLLVRTFNLP